MKASSAAALATMKATSSSCSSALLHGRGETGEYTLYVLGAGSLTSLSLSFGARILSGAHFTPPPGRPALSAPRERTWQRSGRGRMGERPPALKRDRRRHPRGRRSYGISLLLLCAQKDLTRWWGAALMTRPVCFDVFVGALGVSVY